jgi:ribosomal protein S12 methylthiotransferase accessory factor
MAAERYKRLLDLIPYLVDEHVGIINRVQELPLQASSPDLFHFNAQACNTTVFCRHGNFPNAGGASTDRATAYCKAIGEAVERYCAAIYDADDFDLFASCTATVPCVDPSAFALYSQEQLLSPNFPWTQFNQRTVVRWVKATDLVDGAACFVPAAMVYVPYYYYSDSGDCPIVQPISTGLACHVSMAEALISAICEVVERDAFTICWQAMMAPPTIPVDSLDENNRELAGRFVGYGRRLFIKNLTLDHGIPTILSLLYGASPSSPALVAAAASSLDPSEAVRKSLEELGHTSRYCHLIKQFTPAVEITPSFPKVIDQVSHLGLYCDHSNLSLAAFINDSHAVIDFSKVENLSTGNVEKDLRVLIDRINGVGHRVLACDITTDDVRTLGLRVVRALVPGFHPLFVGHTNRALGGSRLWTLPQKLGYRGVSRETGDNPAPHGYP